MMQGNNTKTKGNSQSTLNFSAVSLNRGNSPQSSEIYKVGNILDLVFFPILVFSRDGRWNDYGTF